MSEGNEPAEKPAASPEGADASQAHSEDVSPAIASDMEEPSLALSVEYREAADALEADAASTKETAASRHDQIIDRLNASPKLKDHLRSLGKEGAARWLLEKGYETNLRATIAKDEATAWNDIVSAATTTPKSEGNETTPATDATSSEKASAPVTGEQPHAAEAPPTTNPEDTDEDPVFALTVEYDKGAHLLGLEQTTVWEGMVARFDVEAYEGGLRADIAKAEVDAWNGVMAAGPISPEAVLNIVCDETNTREDLAMAEHSDRPALIAAVVVGMEDAVRPSLERDLTAAACDDALSAWATQCEHTLAPLAEQCVAESAAMALEWLERGETLHRDQMAGDESAHRQEMTSAEATSRQAVQEFTSISDVEDAARQRLEARQQEEFSELEAAYCDEAADAVAVFYVALTGDERDARKKITKAETAEYVQLCVEEVQTRKATLHEAARQELITECTSTRRDTAVEEAEERTRINREKQIATGSGSVVAILALEVKETNHRALVARNFEAELRELKRQQRVQCSIMLSFENEPSQHPFGRTYKVAEKQRRAKLELDKRDNLKTARYMVQMSKPRKPIVYPVATMVRPQELERRPVVAASPSPAPSSQRRRSQPRGNGRSLPPLAKSGALVAIEDDPTADAARQAIRKASEAALPYWGPRDVSRFATAVMKTLRLPPIAKPPPASTPKDATEAVEEGPPGTTDTTTTPSNQ